MLGEYYKYNFITQRTTTKLNVYSSTSSTLTVFGCFGNFLFIAEVKNDHGNFETFKRGYSYIRRKIKISSSP